MPIYYFCQIAVVEVHAAEECELVAVGNEDPPTEVTPFLFHSRIIKALIFINHPILISCSYLFLIFCSPSLSDSGHPQREIRGHPAAGRRARDLLLS